LYTYRFVFINFFVYTGLCGFKMKNWPVFAPESCTEPVTGRVKSSNLLFLQG